MDEEDQLFPVPLEESAAATETPLAHIESESLSLNKQKIRTRTERKYPALTFTEAISLAEAIQTHASGQKVRRLTLFEKINRSPDSSTSRILVTSSSQYGLTKGGYTAEFLELTAEGRTATADDSGPITKLRAKFDLALKNVQPFYLLYTKFKGNKMPAREVLADHLEEASIPLAHRDECIDTFTVNAKSLGLLRTIAGSERLVSIEQALEELPVVEKISSPTIASGSNDQQTQDQPASSDASDETIGDFSKVCFYVTPIGEDGSDAREHADFMMEFVVKPALKEFGLSVIRADQMGQPGMIGKQVVEHILKARLVIADLSFHNPNVFYELCLRHTTRLPTVQLKRAVDRLPFDLNQSRTISIDTADVYRLYPRLQTHIAEVATQVRRALQDIESADNPISLYYPKAKLTWS